VSRRCAGLLVVVVALAATATAAADCSWSIRWPTDDRIWAIPWGTVPAGTFRTQRECEGAVQHMLQEAIRGQALLVEVPACVCASGRDDWASESYRFAGR
jgi:hypothetical protein